MSQRWFSERVERALSERAQQNLLRQRFTCEPTGPGVVIKEGHQLINFGSNDYLGLAWHEQVRRATMSTDVWGSGASPLVTGRSPAHDALESTIAAWKKAASCLTFSSGYATNVSVVSALAGSNDFLFSDELNHASLIDGCRLSKADVQIYPHNDMQRLREMLRRCARQRLAGQGIWLVSDTIFSMEGDAALVQDIVNLASEFDAGLIFDEAHAVGVYGAQGAGLAINHDLNHVPCAIVGTCSKALGSIGGYVTANAPTIDYLRQFARGYIYSTAVPAAAANATATAIHICQQMNNERAALRATARELRDWLRNCGWQTTGDDSPIVPLYLADSQAVLRASQRLFEQGLYVPAIRPPTVPVHKSLLRISLSASHTASHITELKRAIVDLRI